MCMHAYHQRHVCDCTVCTTTITFLSYFGSSGHYCSNGSLLQREPKVLLCSLTGMAQVPHGNVCRALLVSLLFRLGAVSAVNSVLGTYVLKCQVLMRWFGLVVGDFWMCLLCSTCPSPVSLVEEWFSMAALLLLQFGNPLTPSFLGDFFCAGYFMFDFKGLLWSFMVPVVMAAALLAAAGRDVFVCGGAPFAWRCPTCFQPLHEPPLRDAMLAALIGFSWYIFVQTEGLLFVFGGGFCQNWCLTGSWIDFYMLMNAPASAPAWVMVLTSGRLGPASWGVELRGGPQRKQRDFVGQHPLM